MRTITALLFAVGIVVSGVASADYSQAVARREYCHTVGDMGAYAFYKAHDRHTPRTKQEHISKALGEMAEPGYRNADVYLYAVDYAFDKATDEENARRMAWAYCMDNAH